MFVWFEFVGDGAVEALGMQWLSSGYCFSFSGVVVPDDLCVTKRIVLSCNACLFDLLGFVAPFVVEVKLLFQELWSIGLGWDKVVSVNFQGRLWRWLQWMESILQWSIPRSYVGYSWWEAELPLFWRWLREGLWGMRVCQRSVLGWHLVSLLVFCAARDAPLKKLSLPRFQFLGHCCVHAWWVQVHEALKIHKDTLWYCWTDSKVVLAWIKCDRRKGFVASLWHRFSLLQHLVSGSMQLGNIALLTSWPEVFNIWAG